MVFSQTNTPAYETIQYHKLYFCINIIMHTLFCVLIELQQHDNVNLIRQCLFGFLYIF